MVPWTLPTEDDSQSKKVKHHHQRFCKRSPLSCRLHGGTKRVAFNEIIICAFPLKKRTQFWEDGSFTLACVLLGPTLMLKNLPWWLPASRYLIIICLIIEPLENRTSELVWYHTTNSQHGGQKFREIHHNRRMITYTVVFVQPLLHWFGTNLTLPQSCEILVRLFLIELRE